MKTLIEDSCAKLDNVRKCLSQVIVGQETLIERLLLALLCDGHVLIEGVPGVAKTLVITTLARSMEATFSRVQFTPDLLPSDLIGSLVYDPKEHSFSAEKGPVFANLVLADEINRAPAKVQSALLESMQEKQVTLGKETFPLPHPFLVMATQNPIEQEGTYALPEAQVDRFMFKLKVGYPSMEEEHQVMRRMARTAPKITVDPVIHLNEILDMRTLLDKVYIDEKVERYILRVVDATRNPGSYGLDIARYMRFGASPRATIYLSLAARGYALLNQREFTVPQDIKDVAGDILRHRIALSYRAEAEGLSSDDLIIQILENVPIVDE
ncbi:AAA family ATPase [Candidatus Pelagisphaera phototrophica]|uniref:AAA family ATPase n=1 Tax=Candidatus Pelagisphaera phototrophica TaxID=2684113 RepID=UPI0019F73157|nr:AAA family ATPase [Candidatus Pelagisphaera phototrophica]QXD33548.1 AAA family ATPase [Candidatus Pelagisphaera phototrophica]